MKISEKVAANILTVSDLSISHGDKKLLDKLHFSVKPGEVLAIIGANGAGKSTLLNTIIDGVNRRDGLIGEGKVEFLGQALDVMNPLERAQQLALLPQNSHLPFPFTVEEVIALGRTPHSTGKVVDQQIVKALMSSYDLAHLAEQAVPTLSGGERQRVHLARVLAQLTQPTNETPPARLLLLDEPCNALDMQHQQLLLNNLKQLQADNIAVILVSHDLNWAIQCADRFLALKQGELINEGRAHKVITSECLREIYDIDATILSHPNNQRPVVLI